MEDLKVGDVVCLKSQTGCKMTLEYLLNGTTSASCVWFNTYNGGCEFERIEVRLAALQLWKKSNEQ